MAPKPSQDTLIHCEACGEDYSSTYRSCPFCGARNDPRRTSGRADPKSSSRYIPTPPPARDQGQDRSRRDDRDTMDDTYVFDGQDAFDEDLEDEDYYTPRPKGGKRLAPKEGGGFDLPPINWPRLITFLCSLVIIVAALIIVFTYIYPQLHDSREESSAPVDISAPPSMEPSLPIYSAEPSPDVTAPVEPSADPAPPSAAPSTPVTTGTPATVVNASSGLQVRSGPGTSYEVVDSLVNGDPINVIAPADNGWYNISYSGGTNIVKTGYIMGDYISTIAGVTTTAPAPSTPAPSTPAPVISQAPSNGNPTVGRSGIIVNADGGLNVRPDPSTSNPAIATLVNGNPVQVVADAGNGWYQITFSGRGGVATPGYIRGEYISTN